MYAFFVLEWVGIPECESCHTHMTPCASPVLVWNQPEPAHVFVTVSTICSEELLLRQVQP